MPCKSEVERYVSLPSNYESLEDCGRKTILISALRAVQSRRASLNVHSMHVRQFRPLSASRQSSTRCCFSVEFSSWRCVYRLLIGGWRLPTWSHPPWPSPEARPSFVLGRMKPPRRGPAFMRPATREEGKLFQTGKGHTTTWIARYGTKLDGSRTRFLRARIRRHQR